MGKNKLIHALDETDKTILRLLQQDGSMSTLRLAEQVSLSVTPCWRRLKRLEEEGYIRDYQANLDRRKLGFDVLAFISVRFGQVGGQEPDHFDQLVRQNPQVLYCHKVTGDADYLLQVVAENLDDYGRFVEMLRHIPGVYAIHSNLALGEIKASSRLPVPGVASPD